MRHQTFSAMLFAFIPLLPAEAQDLDVPGNLTMVNSTQSAGNILKGGVPFLHDFGTANTFLGSNAGNLTMSGYGGNTASGAGALSSNINGWYNTASGLSALQNNTTGTSNTASGVQALSSNTTGSQNTASGTSALGSNTTGSQNTASGLWALQYNTTGVRNTAGGLSALQFNTTGTDNTASGTGALYRNTTGSNNTAIGVVADVSEGNLSNATAIGAGAIVNASNKIRLGNDLVTVVETAGDVYLKRPGSGFILTSPNGGCWRTTVADDGTLSAVLTACP